MTCPACQRSLLVCSCPGVDEQIRLFLRSPEGLALRSRPADYNALVRKAADIIGRRLGDPPPRLDMLLRKRRYRKKRLTTSALKA